MKDILQALQNSGAYEHSVGAIQVIETHLSWIFLTGEYAYKLKKPLELPFVDFSTLERRGYYCREEVRLNRQYTDDLYMGVLPVIRYPDNSIIVAESPVSSDATTIDWVVKMHQFDQSCQADRLVASNGVGSAHFYEFGARLAQQHSAVQAAVEPTDAGDAIHENFTTLSSISGISEQQAQISRLLESSLGQLSRWSNLLLERRLNGFVRECHGDLHLANIMCQQGRLQAFDCLEFNRGLREIDVWNDVAFLVMDCCVRHREDLAYSFVDGYLDRSGDYQGAILLNLYGRYRSMVRAKVAAIAYDQSGGNDNSAYERFRRHLDWTEKLGDGKPGQLVVCCGLSGSGKSYWSAQLVPKLAAIRLRSDVFRKISAGLGVDENSASGIGSGLYDPQRSDALYSELTQLSSHLLQQGENVIVDATCLTKDQRDQFLSAAKGVGAKSIVLHLAAPDSVLRKRIVKRQQEGSDVSEADLAVLDWQQQHQEVPEAPEPMIVVDSSTIDIEGLASQIKIAIDRLT